MMAGVRALAKLLPKGLLTSNASRAFSSSGTSQSGFIEVREYTLKPEGMKDFLAVSQEYAQLRSQLLPFLGMFTADIGTCLHKVVHFYHYKDFDARDDLRSAALSNPEWQKFIRLSRPHVQHQENKVMLECTPVYEALGLQGAAAFKASSPASSSSARKAMYELRSYQLHPGYGSVPKLVEAFKKGLPAKVAADPEQGQLVLFAGSDVGILNNVVELWRYPSAQACIRARQAARKVPEWRETIGAVTPGVQHFTSAFMYPVPFSPWQ